VEKGRKLKVLDTLCDLVDNKTITIQSINTTSSTSSTTPNIMSLPNDMSKDTLIGIFTVEMRKVNGSDSYNDQIDQVATKVEQNLISKNLGLQQTLKKIKTEAEGHLSKQYLSDDENMNDPWH
jgi:hypothetical protein